MDKNQRLVVRTVSKTEHIIPLTDVEIGKAWNDLINSKIDSFILIGEIVFNRRNIESFRKR